MYTLMQHKMQSQMDTVDAMFLASFDLPQVAEEDDMLIELIQDISQRPYEEVAAELHHQIDPSYQ